MKNLKYLIITLVVLVTSCKVNNNSNREVINTILCADSSRVISMANNFLDAVPVPITNFYCERSSGGRHDYYSEGDYWWPNPDNPNGPYIRRDGESNPDNFNSHRKAMRSMSIQVAALTAAFKITEKQKYADKAVEHLKVWFVDTATVMNPQMLYAQAIKGRVTGRGIGLIDGIHLIEPAKAVTVLHQLGGIDDDIYREVKAWFAKFLNWMNTHPYGISERDWKNNHGTWWAAQAAEYADLTGNTEITKLCIAKFKNEILKNQMAEDGSFPLELERTKPYNYSLFNLEGVVTLCHILSSNDVDLWHYKLKDGRGVELAVEFMFPYIFDKSTWPYKKDVQHWDEWPVRQPSLLFSGVAYGNENFIKLWQSLSSQPKSEEGKRTFPIKQPILWY